MTAKNIKETLLAQLKRKSAKVSHFESLIDDYIFYWQKEKDMQKDIKSNGLKYKRTSAQGYEIEVENPAVKSSVMYNKQKLSILKELGLSTESCVSGEDDEL